jgi:hypothetical protein
VTSTTPEDAPEAPKRPWHDAFIPLSKAPQGRFGYLHSGKLVCCSREELLEHRQLPHFLLVLWDSDDGDTTLAIDVPEIRKEILKRVRRSLDGRKRRIFAWPIGGFLLSLTTLSLPLPTWLAWAPVVVALAVTGFEVWTCFLRIPKAMDELRAYERKKEIESGTEFDEADLGQELKHAEELVLYSSWIHSMPGTFAWWIATPNIAVFIATLFDFDHEIRDLVSLQKGAFSLPNPGA